MKVGFLVDDEVVDYYTFQVIKSICDTEGYVAVAIINRPHIVSSQKVKFFFRLYQFFRQFGLLSGFRKVVYILLVRLLNFIERKPVRNRYPNFFEHRRIDGLKNLRIFEIHSRWSQNNVFCDVSTGSISDLHKLHFDILVRCGSGILKGDILSVAKLGIISFHHGDNRLFRGGPFGFWEIMLQKPVSGFVVQLLSPELDGGKVLLRGSTVTQRLWLLNQAHLLEKSAFCIQKVLTELKKGSDFTKDYEVCFHDRPIDKLGGSSRVLLKYMWIAYGSIAFLKLRKLLRGSKRGKWSVRYRLGATGRDSLFRFKEIENLEKSFFADPFIVKFNNKLLMYVEEFDEKRGKGHISAIELCDEGHKYLGPAIIEEFHMSFPYTFVYEDQLYMVPETHEDNAVWLYHCVEFPLKWRRCNKLLSDVEAVDTMVFKHGKRWFLLTNICSAGIRDFGSELHIFWAEDLTSETWKPLSSGNPVIFDASRARNGGLIILGEDVYRVSQKQGYGHYGIGFQINKIKCLSRGGYAEDLVQDIDGKFDPTVQGTHHLYLNSGMASFDVYRQ